MSNHTPGPWRVARQKSAVTLENLGIVWDANGRPVAYVGGHTDGHLLAAAPDLLAACVEYRDHGPSALVDELVEYALRKAEGGDDERGL